VSEAVSGRPAIIQSGADPAIAFLHMPDPEEARSTAVLICPPFGWEEMCSYRGVRSWATALARAGYPTARINLPSAGDSGGSPRDFGRVASWIGAIGAAVRWLRETTTATTVAGLGIGLGAMLICLAIAQDVPIEDLILWAIPARGRTLLREMRAYSSVVAAAFPEDERPDSLPDGDLALTGFLMTGETASALSEVDLAELELSAPTDRRILLLGRDGIAADKRLAEHFKDAGAGVEVEDGGGYGALMSHPEQSEPPLDTIAKTIAWLDRAPSGSRTGTSTRGGTPPPEHASMELSHDDHPIRETPIELGRGGKGTMLGIVTESMELEGAPVCAVWLNGGALRHIGPNRAWVEAARRWAARGIPTVRVDLRGIGDSEGEDLEPGEVLPSLYADQRTEQTLAIMDELSSRGFPDRFVLGGLCSGAYWSLHAALADSRVAGAMLINLYSFFWSRELVKERDTHAAMARLRATAGRQRRRPDLNAKLLKKVVTNMRPGRIRASAGRPVEGAQADRVNEALDTLRLHGTETLFLLSHSEPLYDQFARQRQLERLERWPNVTIERIPSRDHMFRAIWLQSEVHDALDRAVERVLTGVPAGRQLPRR
jgi:pimeloyl-ACP methyl ester carboxylesterase